MPLAIYYVGVPEEMEHHARPLCGEFDVRIENAENVVRFAHPGDVCLFYNEFFPRYRLANHALMRKQCATLYALDGILEWRSQWEFPPGMSCLWSARPILSHKVACIGRSQARILESFGHPTQCEIVGVPRFDALAGRTARSRPRDEPFTILVLTAKCAGFDKVQLKRAAQSLIDLKAWFEGHPEVNGVPIRSVWRITQGLENEVGVTNSLRDTTGEDLAEILKRVDAVITTPSTSMLEGMLQQIPVSLLDYNNCPHYVPAAWRITAPNHFDQVVPELITPPSEKMLYQRHLLHDALECTSPSLPRLCELIHSMHEIAERCLAAGYVVTFPKHILPRPFNAPPAYAPPADYAELFPENPAFGEYDLRRLQSEVGDLRDAMAELAHENARLRQQVQSMTEAAERLLAPPNLSEAA